MEVFDYAGFSKEDHQKLIEEEDPCPTCGSEDYLVFGIITTGDDAGEMLVLCGVCDVEFEKEEDKENFFDAMPPI